MGTVKEKNKVYLYIIIIGVIICSLFYTIEQFLEVSYLFTTIWKVILFGVIPYGLYYFFNKVSPFRLIKINKNSNSIKIGLLLGGFALAIIWMTYFIVKSYIDLDLIANELMGSNLITPKNYPFVALYIAFGNSFLEEFFFRGFIFLQLHSLGYKKAAYIFSALLFAIYHVAIFKTWFSPWLILLAVIGLFIGGIIFNYIGYKSESIINSWIIHICSDIAIVVIGFIMFY